MASGVYGVRGVLVVHRVELGKEIEKEIVTTLILYMMGKIVVATIFKKSIAMSMNAQVKYSNRLFKIKIEGCFQFMILNRSHIVRLTSRLKLNLLEYINLFFLKNSA